MLFKTKLFEASSLRVKIALSSIKSHHHVPRAATRGSSGSCEEESLPVSELDTGRDLLQLMYNKVVEGEGFKVLH